MITDAKKVFRQKGTCSRTLAHLLDREFGYIDEAAEAATDPLAGGFNGEGHQCGMLWGSTLAASAEARRISGISGDRAAITASRALVDSYKHCAGCLDCRDFARAQLKNPLHMVKYLLSGGPKRCFDLAENWANEAIQVAVDSMADAEGLVCDRTECFGCATETILLMGGSDEEAAMAAGWSGGIGLSGHGCGALGAAVWKNTLEWMDNHPGKGGYNNPAAKRTIMAFTETTGGKIRCEEIIGRGFSSVEDHSDFIKNGGCREIIDTLAASAGA